MKQTRAPRKTYVAVPLEDWMMLTRRMAHLEGAVRSIYVAFGVLGALGIATLTLAAFAVGG